ncbi:MAG: 30S ribosome-binding factor RbfA [Bacteroidota bacterium]
METKRQQKFSRQIQKDLSEIFQKELKGAFGNAFITITEVKVSPDMSQAKSYLSLMLVADKEGLLEEIRDKTKQIRNILAGKIRHQVRIIPELLFFLDDTAEYAAKMDALISNLDIPPLKEGEVIEN